jgi:uncharacterized protein with ParB-like and HNH nuclease domain
MGRFEPVQCIEEEGLWQSTSYLFRVIITDNRWKSRNRKYRVQLSRSSKAMQRTDMEV